MKPNWALVWAFGGTAVQGVMLAIGLSTSTGDTKASIAVLQAQMSSMQSDLNYIRNHYIDKGFSSIGKP